MFLHASGYHYSLVITLHGLPNPLTGNTPSQVLPFLIVFEGEPNRSDRILLKQETHGPHRSPEKTVQINKHI